MLSLSVVGALQMADEWMSAGGGLVSAGLNFAGGLISNANQAAMNSANLSNQTARDQFNAAQVANANNANMAFQQETNALNRDFIWQTNSQNEWFQRETNAWNAAQVQKQMDFQERLSGSAYQRAMADMRAAGLNPILAYQQGGASSMPGASPVGIAPKNVAPQYQAPRNEAFTVGAAPQMVASNELGRAVSAIGTNAIDALKKFAEIDQVQQQTTNLSAQYDQIVAGVAKTEAETKNIKEATVKLTSEINNNVLMSSILKSQGITAEQAAQMGIIDLAAAGQFGGKYAPNAYEQVIRDVLELVKQISGVRTPADAKKLADSSGVPGVGGAVGRMIMGSPNPAPVPAGEPGRVYPPRNDPRSWMFSNPLVEGDRK